MQLTKEQLELNKRFVATLRSGEYSQCKEQLSKMDESAKGGFSYCCLGVAAIVCQPDYFDTAPRDGGVPANAIIDQYGWGSLDPRISKLDSATALNDVSDLTFDQIADCFEATFITPQETK